MVKLFPCHMYIYELRSGQKYDISLTVYTYYTQTSASTIFLICLNMTLSFLINQIKRIYYFVLICHNDTIVNICTLTRWSISSKILTIRATGRKNVHKANQGNKSVMKISYSKANTMSELSKYVSRMKSQLCASAA